MAAFSDPPDSGLHQRLNMKRVTQVPKHNCLVLYMILARFLRLLHGTGRFSKVCRRLVLSWSSSYSQVG